MGVRQVRYSRYEGPAAPDPGQLLAELADHLLESGFRRRPFDPDPAAGTDFGELLRAIAATLEAAGHVPPGSAAAAAEAGDWQATETGRLALRFAQGLREAGFLDYGGPPTGAEPEALPLTFALTTHGTDLLGRLALAELTGFRGGRLPGLHRSRRDGSSPETTGGSRPWRFGDTLGLAATETLKEAARHGLKEGRIRVTADDLHVQEAEDGVRAATVLLLDCSHSMILYGEDRFTPGKKVALALAGLIRSRFPGDSLRFVLFHDGAEEVSLEQLATVQVGPYHTNTAGGLRIARRLLQREAAGSRHIMMITDGKPTAITLPGGRTYRNAYGQDPLVLQETMREVTACRRLGIPISTFMLARDPALLEFVARTAEMTGGRAYTAGPAGLGRLVLREFTRSRAG